MLFWKSNNKHFEKIDLERKVGIRAGLKRKSRKIKTAGKNHLEESRSFL